MSSREEMQTSTTFDLTYPHDGWVSIFENLDLGRGTYWLGAPCGGQVTYSHRDEHR